MQHGAPGVFAPGEAEKVRRTAPGEIRWTLAIHVRSTTSADFWWTGSPPGELMGGSIGVRPGEVAHDRSGSGLGTGLRGLAEARSEERRVGKECRSRWSPYH